MPTSASTTFSALPLLPAYNADQARTVSFRIKPLVALAKGTVVAELAASRGSVAAYSGTKVTPPATPPTLAAVSATSPGAGTYYVAYSFANSSGETTLSPIGVLTISGAQGIQVSAIALPANVTAINYYMSAQPGGPLVFQSQSTTGAQFTITALPAATNQLPPVSNGCFAATDGSATAVGILQYDVASDASGNITFGSAAGGGPHGETYLSAPVFYRGAFNTGDLSGLDATALAQLGGHLVNGTLAGPGVVEIG